MIYLKLIWSYLKIGLFGFGGGYAMLSLIQREIVTPGWITEKMFTDIVAISQMTPGPIGINSATYIGYSAPLMAGYSNPLWGILGSVLCTLTVVLPSFILVAWTSHYIRRNRESVVIRGIFAGLRPVVIGLIASAALLLMNSDNFGDTTASGACLRDYCCGRAVCGAVYQNPSDMGDSGIGSGRFSYILLNKL